MAETLPAPDNLVPAPQPMQNVIVGGLATTFITLGLLYLLSRHGADINPMGWYADYVFPIGALMVGLAAGSGYGILSWAKGIKIRRGLLVAIVMLQFGAYVAAEYIDYRDLVARATEEAASQGEAFSPAGFVQYYRFKAENFAWKPEHGETAGQPLGKWGYFFTALAVVGFVGGGLVAPVICMGVPYCEGCQRYMRSKKLGLMPASVPFRKIKKHDADGQKSFAEEMDRASELADQNVQKLNTFAAAGDATGFSQIASEAFADARHTKKLPARIQTHLVQCPACERGWIRNSLMTGQGKKIVVKRLDKTLVNAEFANVVRRK